MTREAHVDEGSVTRLALLARLTLTDKERDAIRDDINSILTYVDNLKSVVVENVAPMMHAPSAAARTWRDDVVQPSLSVDQAMQNAPERLGDGFGVPQVIE